MQLELPITWDKEAVSWAAGFYEGEGTVCRYAVEIPQVNVWPLQKLKNIFGGTIAKIKVQPPRQDAYRWTLSGSKGRDFITSIYPHLSPKRQAQIDDQFLTWEKYRIAMAKKHRAWAEKIYGHVVEFGRDSDGKIRGRR